MSKFSINIHHTFSDAENIWRDFQKDSSMFPFQDYDFLQSWFGNIGIKERVLPVFVSVFRCNGSPLLFLPFGVREWNSFRKLEWFGTGFGDYGAPILKKDFEINCDSNMFLEIWSAIIEASPRVDVIVLKNQPPKVGDQKNPFVLLSKDSLVCRSYSADLTRDWAEFSSVGPRKRICLDSSRQLKRLAAFGKISFKIAETKEEAKKILDILVAQKERQYYETIAENIFTKVGVKEFYADVCDRLLPKNIAQLSALILNDEILACHWGLIYQKRYYYLMPSYSRDEWARYSTGRLLMEFLIKWSIENKLDEFDFTIGDEGYKKNWCTQETHMYEYVEARTLKGIFCYLVWLIKLKIRSHKFLYCNILKVANQISKL